MSTSSDLVIDLHDVSKTYRGKVRALRGISLQVKPGGVFGLLGPNGAGKSTLVKILMTIIRPTHCEGSFLGEPVGTKSELSRVGYLPEHLKFPSYLTAQQAMDCYGALAKVSSATRKKRSTELLDLVGLADWRDHKIKSFSKGMKQRLGVAQALINDPELVILDEPTDGVDPKGRREIRDLLKQIADEGRTVFLNSHLLAEVEMVCDQVVILSKGKIIQQGRVEDLTAHSRRYEIDVVNAPPKDPEFQTMLEAMEGRIEPLPQEQHVDSRIVVPLDDPEALQPLIDALRERLVVIESIESVRQSLEDYFIDAVDEANAGERVTPGAIRD